MELSIPKGWHASPGAWQYTCRGQLRSPAVLRFLLTMLMCKVCSFRLGEKNQKPTGAANVVQHGWRPRTPAPTCGLQVQSPPVPTRPFAGANRNALVILPGFGTPFARDALYAQECWPCAQASGSPTSRRDRIRAVTPAKEKPIFQ